MNEQMSLSTRESISPYLSRKLKLISLFTMLCVVFIHAYNYLDTFLTPSTMLQEGAKAGPIIQFLISNGLTRFATPMFFAISGYLFFVAFKKLTFRGYLQKLGKRARTLLLPYAIWVGLWTGIGALIVLTVGMDYFPIVGEKLGGLFGGQWWAVITDPLPFQTWYLLDLFKLVLISPLIYLLAKYLRWGAPLLTAVPWAIDYSVPYFVNCDGLLFFTLGAYLALREVNFPGKDKPERVGVWHYLLPALWVTSCVTYAVLSGFGKQINLPWYVLLALYKVNVLLGVCSVMLLYDLLYYLLPDKITGSKWLDIAASGTFFVYILHEPLQHMIFQTVLKYTNADWAHMLCYFATPIVLAIAAIALSCGIRALSPKLHNVLTGGR